VVFAIYIGTFVGLRSIHARTEFYSAGKRRERASVRVVITHQSVDSEQIAISRGTNSSSDGKDSRANIAENATRLTSTAKANMRIFKLTVTHSAKF